MLFLVSRNSWSNSEGLKHTICFTHIRTVILVLKPSAENVLGRWETLRKAKRKGGRQRKKVRNVSEYRFSCSPLNSQEIEEQNSVEKNFIQKSWWSGEMVASCLETNSQDSAQPWNIIKGKGKLISATWDRESDSCLYPIEGKLVNATWSFFRCYLIHTCHSRDY